MMSVHYVCMSSVLFWMDPILLFGVSTTRVSTFLLVE